MGSTAGPAKFRTLTSALVTVVALLAAACLAFAEPPDFSERDLTPPKKAHSAAAKTAHAAPKRVEPAAYSEEQNSNQEDTDDEAADTDQSQSDEGAPAKSSANAAENSPAPESGGELSYVIREGDSVGAIAGMFHLPAQDIFRRNHISEGTTLHIGQVLHIPNPYVAQVKDLQKQIDTLTTSNHQQQSKLQDNNSKISAMSAQIGELNGLNRSLEHDVKVLPWWRRATTIAATVAAVMLGITLLSLLQWFLIRWRFVAVADANERLSKLDQRYRVLMARAELRLQQLYGRRRATAEYSAQAKSQEDFELEGLSREVKDVLEHEMARLGVQRHLPSRRSRLREWLASVSSPVEARSDRR
jgi:LysM repeat protein